MFRQVWAGIVFSAAGLELIGLFRKSWGDTLSEFVWSKTDHPLMAGFVVGLCAWLVYHFSFGRGVPLGKWDIMSSVAGILIGVWSRVIR